MIFLIGVVCFLALMLVIVSLLRIEEKKWLEPEPEPIQWLAEPVHFHVYTRAHVEKKVTFKPRYRMSRPNNPN